VTEQLLLWIKSLSHLSWTAVSGTDKTQPVIRNWKHCSDLLILSQQSQWAFFYDICAIISRSTHQSNNNNIQSYDIQILTMNTLIIFDNYAIV